MAIEPGQLRRWCDDVDGLEGTFLVLRSEGMLYPGGHRRGRGGKQVHWEILMHDGIGSWSEDLLSRLSETINEAR